MAAAKNLIVVADALRASAPSGCTSLQQALRAGPLARALQRVGTCWSPARPVVWPFSCCSGTARRATCWSPALVADETTISHRNSLCVFKALWRQRLQTDLAALRRIVQPVLVLAGDADRLTPAAGAQALVAQLPGAGLRVLPACGHQIPLERPQAVYEATAAAAS